MPPNQTGFRKGLDTMDNIYVLNYLVNRQLGMRNGKLVCGLEGDVWWRKRR